MDIFQPIILTDDILIKRKAKGEIILHILGRGCGSHTINLIFYTINLYKIVIILPVILYDCEIWAIALRKERRLEVLRWHPKANIWTQEKWE